MLIHSAAADPHDVLFTLRAQHHLEAINILINVRFAIFEIMLYKLLLLIKHMKRNSQGLNAKRAHAPIKVYVLPCEAEIICGNAKQARMSTSQFLSRVGQGFVPRSVFDHEAVIELARLNASQSRFENLMKLWLSDDVRLSKMNSVQVEAAVEMELKKALDIQDELLAKVKQL